MSELDDDDYEEDSWADYSSEQYFPGCECDHEATDHRACWGDWREGHGCLVEGCPCEVEWEHT